MAPAGLRKAGVPRLGALAAAVSGLLVSACALSGPRLKPTHWAPDRRGFGCPLELVHEESGATLSIRRSESTVVVPAGSSPAGAEGEDAIADYEVKPEGALGVERGQFLRLECRTLRVIGTVPASD